jgi:hypothetical protein
MVKRIQREVTLSIAQRHDFAATTAAAAHSTVATATQCVDLITELK